LHNGLEYVKESNESSVEEYLSVIKSHFLLEVVASAVPMHNDSDLFTQVEQYFSEIKVSPKIMELLYSTRTSLARQKRYTGYNWDSSHPDFNGIATRPSRRNDEVIYPRH